MDHDELKGRIAKACRVLGTLDLTNGSRGHISARIPGTERILIRARGPAEDGVRYTSDEQVIEVDLDGRAAGSVPAGLKPPAEVFIHTELYRARSDVNAVLHLHPPTVVLFTICNTPLLPIYGGYDPQSLGLLLDGLTSFDRSILIDRAELGRELSVAMARARACTMRGHGITTVGDCVEEAALNAIFLNELATMNYQARLLGEPRPISDEDIAALRPYTKRTQSAVSGEPSGKVASEWRYYCRLAGER